MNSTVAHALGVALVLLGMFLVVIAMFNMYRLNRQIDRRLSDHHKHNPRR